MKKSILQLQHLTNKPRYFNLLSKYNKPSSISIILLKKPSFLFSTKRFFRQDKYKKTEVKPEKEEVKKEEKPKPNEKDDLEGEVFYDIESNKTFKHRITEEELEEEKLDFDGFTLSIKDFKDGEYLVLKENSKFHFIYYTLMSVYIVIILYFLRKIYKNKNESRIYRYLFNVFYLIIAIILLTKLIFNIELCRVFVKRIYLLSDGQRIKIKLYNLNEKVFLISKFKRLEKNDVKHINPDILITAIEEGYIVLADEDGFVIPFKNVVVDQTVLTKIAKSQSVQVVNK
jgi:hypothetical protein